MQSDHPSPKPLHNKKRCYSSTNPQYDPIIMTNRKKRKMPSPSYFSLEKLMNKDSNSNSDSDTFDQSFNLYINQIQSTFNHMQIDEISQNQRNASMNEDMEMSSSFAIGIKDTKKKNYTIDWSTILDENDCEETRNTTINYENDIPIISQNTAITEKIIANALESEKTLHRFFDMNPKMIPNERNGIILYDTMREYKEKFERDMLIVYSKANGISFLGYLNETFDDFSMDLVIESSILYEFLGDDDMILD